MSMKLRETIGEGVKPCNEAFDDPQIISQVEKDKTLL